MSSDPSSDDGSVSSGDTVQLVAKLRKTGGQKVASKAKEAKDDNDSSGTKDDPPVPVVRVEATTITKPAKKSTKQVRNQWPKIDKHMLADGKKVTSHPFLEDENNHMDKVVVRHLIVEQPFLASHGSTVAAWTEAAAKMNMELHPETGDKIFFPPLSGASLKARFDAYMKFAKSNQNEVPFNSGGDDEEAPNEIQQGIEDLFSVLESFKAQNDMSKKKAASNKKGDMAAAEMIRRASLGEKLGDEDFAKTPACADRHKKKKKDGSGGSGGSGGSSMNPPSSTTTMSLEETLSARNQVSLAKEENKKRKLEVMEKKIALEEQKLEAQVALEKQRLGAQEKQNASMQEFMLAMSKNMGALFAAAARNNNNNNNDD